MPSSRTGRVESGLTWVMQTLKCTGPGMKEGIRPFKLQWMKEVPEKEKWTQTEIWKEIHAAVEVGVLLLSMDDGWTCSFNEMGYVISD